MPSASSCESWKARSCTATTEPGFSSSAMESCALWALALAETRKRQPQRKALATADAPPTSVSERLVTYGIEEERIRHNHRSPARLGEAPALHRREDTALDSGAAHGGRPG